MALGEYVTVKQLQAALNMSRSAIYQACKRGFLPQGIRIGRAHRWRIDEVNAWLDNAGTTGNTTSTPND